MSDLEKFRAAQMQDPEFREICEEMSVSSDIAKAIISARLQKNITQKELAARTGISQGHISRYENCEKEPTVTTLKRIAKAMGFQFKIEFVPIPPEDVAQE